MSPMEHSREIDRTVLADVPSLDGCWVVIAGLLAGVPLPDVALGDLTLTVSDGSFALGVDEGRIALDWDTEPAAMDVLVMRGPNRGRFVPAIFEQRGVTLQICFDLSGQQRPAAFRAPAGSRLFLATYRRSLRPRATTGPPTDQLINSSNCARVGPGIDGGGPATSRACAAGNAA
jgi:uncharacterized protein (TIGR03067 family)